MQGPQPQRPDSVLDQETAKKSRQEMSRPICASRRLTHETDGLQVCNCGAERSFPFNLGKQSRLRAAERGNQTKLSHIGIPKSRT